MSARRLICVLLLVVPSALGVIEIKNATGAFREAPQPVKINQCETDFECPLLVQWCKKFDIITRVDEQGSTIGKWKSYSEQVVRFSFLPASKT